MRSANSRQTKAQPKEWRQKTPGSTTHLSLGTILLKQLLRRMSSMRWMPKVMIAA